MENIASYTRSPLKFFMLVFALSTPFIILQVLFNKQILPGIPLSGLAFLIPAIAAMILEYRRCGTAGIKQLLSRSFDLNRINNKLWYIPILLLYPVLVILSFFILHFRGTAVPAPQFTLLSALLLGIGFFIGGLCEELGWAGYATEPLQHRMGALKAGLVLGCIWAIWHWIPLVQVQRSALWIMWWTLGTIAARVIMAWLFNHTGQSVAAMSLFHMTINLTWQLSPDAGSYFDIRLVALLVAAVAVVIVIVLEPETLLRCRIHFTKRKR